MTILNQFHIQILSAKFQIKMGFYVSQFDSGYNLGAKIQRIIKSGDFWRENSKLYCLITFGAKIQTFFCINLGAKIQTLKHVP